MDPVDSAKATEPVRKKSKGRRWLKICGGTAAGAVLGAVVAWQFRTPIANAVLKRVSPDFPATVESLEWENGGLSLRGLTLTTPGGGETILRLHEGHVALEARNAPSGKLGRVVLQGPEIKLGKGFWREVERLTNTASAPGPEQRGFPISVAGIDIRAAKFHLEGEHGSAASGEFEWQGGGISGSADGGISASRQTLKLKSLKYEPAPQAPPLSVDGLEVEFSLTAEDRKLTVHRMLASGMEIRLDSAIWNALGWSGAAPEHPLTGQTPPPPQQLSAGRPVIERVEIEHCSAGPMQVVLDSLPWVPGLPPIRAGLTLTGGNGAGGVDGKPGATLLQATVEDLTVARAGESPWLSAPRFTARLQMDAAGAWRIDQAELGPTAVRFNQKMATELHLPSGLPIPDMTATLSAQLSGIELNDDGIHMTAGQRLGISSVEIAVPGSAEPLARWKSLILEGTVAEVAGQKRLRRLVWEEPAVVLTDRDLQFFASASAVPSASAEPDPAANSPPFWEGLRCDEIKVTGGAASMRQLGGGIPDASLDFQVKTAPVTPGGEVLHQLAATNIRVAQPDAPAAPPLYRGRRLLICAHPERIWSKRRIESVHLSGSRVEIGATENHLDVPDADRPLAATHYVTPESGVVDEIKSPVDWHVREVLLEDTKVHLHGLVPDVSEVVVPIARKSLHFVPLTPAGLKQSDGKERIELPFVYIPGTRAGSSVADLDTNFVHFTLGGLMQKRIDLVEAVNPKIYVGDSLFHYVEKFRTENASPAAPPAAQVHEILTSLITLLTAEEAPPASGGWGITRLRLINGKLFSTVKDSPLYRVPPLPFGADSALSEGEIKAELAIPPGIYKPVLGLELVARINEGRIVFNLPKKGRDNNLVQVFKADWLRYKQFRIADVTLTVTYDENGIYTKFWAKGYGGDLEGAFNLYLDDQLSWDLWVAGNQVDVGDLTRTLTPNYFTMEGRIGFKVIAQGDRSSLYQATGDFRGLVPGRTKIVALEDLIKNIPEDWTEVQRKWTIKALETLRDFRYDKCTGDLRFYGLEGFIRLHLAGPDGQRNFDVRSHDRRLRVEASP